MILIYFISAYLLGSIPTALIVGKLLFGIDIREYGSNNPGATNSLRVLGKKAALMVLIVDVGKGALAAGIPFFFEVDIDPIMIGLVAVIGHCFPIFAGFRGGKAIATTAGVLAVSHFYLFLLVYVAFILVILITKYVFIGSISVGFVLFLYSLFSKGTNYELIFLLFTFFLVFLHRTNIQNYLYGKEPKINDNNLKNDLIKK